MDLRKKEKAKGCDTKERCSGAEAWTRITRCSTGSAEKRGTQKVLPKKNRGGKVSENGDGVVEGQPGQKTTHPKHPNTKKRMQTNFHPRVLKGGKSG